ncbi:MAG: zinc-ribbon domain-containing protein [Oscillospiraceae bacterium]|jgi:ribosomal protein S27E|nr:zinc-ribbon domain-containing protein [Oscillospiraceae bacterium]
MSYLKKLGYVKGLAEGLALDENTKETRVLRAMIDLLDEMTDVLSSVEEANDHLGEELSSVTEDVRRLDETVDNIGGCMETITDGLSHLLETLSDEDDDEDDEDDEEIDLPNRRSYYYEIQCPKCNEDTVINEEMLEEGSVQCPKCGETLEFEFDCNDPNCDGQHHP